MVRTFTAAKFFDAEARKQDLKNLFTLGSVMGLALGVLVNLPLLMH